MTKLSRYDSEDFRYVAKMQWPPPIPAAGEVRHGIDGGSCPALFQRLSKSPLDLCPSTKQEACQNLIFDKKFYFQ
jgi:hypothetical protein